MTEMQRITTFSSTCVPFNRNNVDTDQIIPARFLKGIAKTGLGQNLFYDWRYLPDGSPQPDFALNDPRYAGAILVVGHNFGCGSSREHAPWALKDYGFRAILGVSFADIFRNNALKNQILPVALPEAAILKLLADIERDPTLTVTIDLPNQQVIAPNQPPQSFEVDAYRKQCLIEGLDDIGYMLSHLKDIETYEAALSAARPSEREAV